jgi:hypothetical protein
MVRIVMVVRPKPAEMDVGPLVVSSRFVPGVGMGKAQPLREECRNQKQDHDPITHGIKFGFPLPSP